jgi:hypothetical protein
MRVFGWQTHGRNESERIRTLFWAQYRPVWILLMDLSKSMCAGTRKMVNYAWIG